MLSLLKGDCLEVMKTLSAKSVDCFVCDLPYGCLTANSNNTRKRFIDGEDTGTFLKGETIGGCAWDIKIDLVQFWEQVKRLSRNDHTPVLMFCNTRFGAELIASNPKWFRYDLVWNKMRGVSFLSANKMPMKSHEMVYVFSKKGAYYKRVDIEGDFKLATGGRNKRNNPSRQYGEVMVSIETNNEGRRCALSVINNPTSSTGNHPTEKPAELYEWLLKRYCPEGGTMLDPTAGSFNSCFTAKEMGLKAIGIEKDSGFFWKGVSRL
jgi:site-specific DNA-methyltransferase (adenine-specific)